MNTPATTRHASKGMYLSRMCIGDFGDYTANLMYMSKNGVGSWLGGEEPKSWRYAR